MIDERQELLVISRDYEDLRDSPGWKRLAQFMADYFDRALAAVRQSQSADPKVNDALARIWRERENFMHAIHSEIAGAIENRKTMITEELESRGASDDQIDSILEMENLLHG